MFLIDSKYNLLIIRVFIADDHEVVRQGLKNILSLSSDFEVVGEGGTKQDILDLVPKLNPDLLLLDFNLEKTNALELLADLKLLKIQTEVLVISMHDEDLYALKCLESGAKGYIGKDASSEEIYKAIKKVAKSEVYASEKVQKLLLESYRGNSKKLELSPRELEVLRLFAKGKSLSEIGHELNISIKTVSTHKTNTLNKLNLKNDVDLLRYIIDNKLDT